MKQLVFMILILLAVMLWPLVTGASEQPITLFLTPTLPCNTTITAAPITGSRAAEMMPTTNAPQEIAVLLTPTPSTTPKPPPNPCLPSTLIPTGTTTAHPVFWATVGVTPHAPYTALGETFPVTITLKVSPLCYLPIMELTVSQITDGEQPFAPAEPIVVTPPVYMPITIHFTAVTTGTASFGANIFGEQYCGDFWVWTYQSGISDPVIVSNLYTPEPIPTPYRVYIPIHKGD